LPQPNRIIESDRRLLGYGAHDATFDQQFSGIWNGSDLTEHINVLELKAAYLAVKHFCANSSREHVQLLLDNTTAIKYIAKMGGRIPKLNELVKEMWQWCARKYIWISAYHIPGKINSRADALSRQKLNDDMEWALSDSVFTRIMKTFGQCSVDMFASRVNKRLFKYVSYAPDCKAVSVNAFSLNWKGHFSYMFPPFSLIGSVLQKLEQDEAEAVLVAPLFSTQPWFPRLLQMSAAQPRILPPIKEALWHPAGKAHRLQKMQLAVFRVSGKDYVAKEYHKTLLTLSSLPGEKVPKNNMKDTSLSGCSFVSLGRLMHLTPV